MKRAILAWAWKQVKPVVVEWLNTRALVLSEAKKTELAFKAKVRKEEIEIVNQAVIEQALLEVERFNP